MTNSLYFRLFDDKIVYCHDESGNTVSIRYFGFAQPTQKKGFWAWLTNLVKVSQ